MVTPRSVDRKYVVMDFREQVCPGRDLIAIGQCRDVYLPGGKPTGAASYWLLKAEKEVGRISPELRKVLESLRKRRLAILGCADLEILDEIFETMVAALNEEIGDGLDIFGGEVPPRIELSSVQDWFRQVIGQELPGEQGRDTQSLIRLTSTDATGEVLSAIRRLRSTEFGNIERALEQSKKYIIILCPLDALDNVNTKLIGITWHRIDFLPWRLEQEDATAAENVLKEFRAQRARGLWPHKDGELFDELYQAIEQGCLVETIKGRKQARFDEKIIEGAIEIGCPETVMESMAIFIAVFLPGLSRNSFHLLMCRLLAEGKPSEPTDPALEERWRSESARVLAACSISAAPRVSSWGDSQVLEVQISAVELREHYRRIFHMRAFLTYVAIAERLFELKPIFDSDLRLREVATRLLAELTVAYPDRFNPRRLKGWVMDWIMRVSAGEAAEDCWNSPRSIASRLETLFRAGLEFKKFELATNEILETILDSEYWQVGTEILQKLRNVQGFDVYNNWLRFLRAASFGLGKGDSSGQKSEKIRADLGNHAVSGGEAFDEAFSKLMRYIDEKPEVVGAHGLLFWAVFRSLKISRFDSNIRVWGLHALAGAVASNRERLEDVFRVIQNPKIQELVSLNEAAESLCLWLFPKGVSSFIDTAIRQECLQRLKRPDFAKDLLEPEKGGSILLLAWLVADLACSRPGGVQAEEDSILPEIRSVVRAQLNRVERSFLSSALAYFEAMHLVTHSALRRAELTNRDFGAELRLATKTWGQFRECIKQLRAEA